MLNSTQCRTCFNELTTTSTYCCRECKNNRFGYIGTVITKSGNLRFNGKAELKEIMALQIQDYTIRFDD